MLKIFGAVIITAGALTTTAAFSDSGQNLKSFTAVQNAWSAAKKVDDATDANKRFTLFSSTRSTTSANSGDANADWLKRLEEAKPSR